MSAFTLVCFDMAGTTVRDDGVVAAAFDMILGDFASDQLERAAAHEYVRATMGQSKIDVFTHLFGERAAAANQAFEDAYGSLVIAQGVAEVPGTSETFAALSAAGIALALTTGFSPSTRTLLLGRLGWTCHFVAARSPSDVGRGRPFPDMLWSCAIAAGVGAMSEVVAVGDTVSDMEAGRRAGAGLCVGVRTGTDASPRLVEGGAHIVIDSVADLPRLLGLD